MNFKISVPIKLYSTYSDSINAPNGFDTPANQLDKSKWRHFNQNCFISLVIERFGGNRATLTTISGENVILDILCTIIGNSNNHFKLSCRSPSLSCKYLKQENGCQILRRFQIEFLNNSDFSNTLIILKSLNIPIKEFTPILNHPLPPTNYTFNNHPVPLTRSYPFVENNSTGNDSFIELESQLTSSQMGSSNLTRKGSILQDKHVECGKKISTVEALLSDNVNRFQENSENNIPNNHNINDIENNESPAKLSTSNDLQRAIDIAPTGNVVSQEIQNSRINKSDLPYQGSSFSYNSVMITDKNRDTPAIPQLNNNSILKGNSNTTSLHYIQPQDQPDSFSGNMEHKQFEKVNVSQRLPQTSYNRITDSATTIVEKKVDTEITTADQTQTVNEPCKTNSNEGHDKSIDPRNSSKTLPKTKVKISKRMIRDKLSDRKFMKWVCNCQIVIYHQSYCMIFT